MFVIRCPYCGERDQTEFTCHGEAHIARPKNPNEVSDKKWGEYLFLEQILKGIIMKDGRMIMDVEDGLM
jgi:heterotetrameric sarcosine oxidase delta subunit